MQVEIKAKSCCNNVPYFIVAKQKGNDKRKMKEEAHGGETHVMILDFGINGA